ncbi:TonB-dependent receptor plug domain-containing protein [Desulfonatronovibrio hydrogenovorans]|uniref:TonB-dependent receptor plug domain-containing protein n=1 Tax=Desulfonatronovibrio hydrogenovorans TaxID=53245 RepID=UPI00049063C4|nr:Plug domain-containing protein [Desulfonatronovibrio hydrogenovorans]
MNLKKKIQGIAVMAALSLHSVLPAAVHQNVAMQEMVVTATRFPEPRERIPGPIQVIDSQQLAELPYERVDEILNWISGVSSDRTLGIYELSPRVTIRGLGENEPDRTIIGEISYAW